jgi:signal transduction histidine kinase
MHLIDYANTQIRAMMDEARQAIWDLRHAENVPNDLVTCIRQMAERLSREYSVSVASSASGEPFPLGHQQTHDLLMVAREAFVNAILHGHPQKIGAEVRFSPLALELVISDDGQGFDPAANLPDDGHFDCRVRGTHAEPRRHPRHRERTAAGNPDLCHGPPRHLTSADSAMDVPL